MRLGGRAFQTMRLRVKLKTGGLSGMLAALIGKSPPDSRDWLVAGDVPAVVQFEGAMFTGPAARDDDGRMAQAGDRHLRAPHGAWTISGPRRRCW